MPAVILLSLPAVGLVVHVRVQEREEAARRAFVHDRTGRPATGSGMKCTTSWARARSKLP